MSPILPPSATELLHAAVETLVQGEAMLIAITQENYTRKIPLAFNASIGGHYRHSLDHFQSLLQACTGGNLNYDNRVRGTGVENNRLAALATTRELIADFERLQPETVGRSLQVTCKTSYITDNTQVSMSSIGREFMYAVAHAVHHYALIAIMAQLMQIQLPEGFGVAPSTLKYQRDQLLAR